VQESSPGEEPQAPKEPAPWESQDVQTASEAQLLNYLDQVVEAEVEAALEPDSAMAQEMKRLVDRIQRAGEIVDHETISRMTSLLYGDAICSIHRYGDRLVHHRAISRGRMPKLMPRITGHYTLNNYLVEFGMREREKKYGINERYHREHLAEQTGRAFA
jgi:hypothetical protein